MLLLCISLTRKKKTSTFNWWKEDNVNMKFMHTAGFDRKKKKKWGTYLCWESNPLQNVNKFPEAYLWGMLKRTEAHSLCTVKEAIFHCIWHYNLRILINCKLLKCQQILLIYPASRKLHPFRERKQQNRELYIHHALFFFNFWLFSTATVHCKTVHHAQHYSIASCYQLSCIFTALRISLFPNVSFY